MNSCNRLLLGLLMGFMGTGAPIARACVGETSQSQVGQPPLGICSEDLRYTLTEADSASLVLLDREGIWNDSAWRSHFIGQILGFGIRTESRKLTQEDVARVKVLLLDSANWDPGIKRCTTQGDAAILLSGPVGSVTVMLELWCGRAIVRDETHLTAKPAVGNIDPIAHELRELALKYHPEDPYLQNLIQEEQ